jgi:hypothetical protein
MDSLSEFGSFAYYFNVIAVKTAKAPGLFAAAALESTVFLLVAAGLSVLANLLLLKTIDLQFSEPILAGGMESLLTQPPSSREGVLNLPFLLKNSAPKNLLGKLLYLLFLACFLIEVMRFSMFWGLELYSQLPVDTFKMWSGLTLLFLVGATCLSFQDMEGAQILCVFLNVMLAICDCMLPQQAKSSQIYSEFPLFMLYLSNQLIVPTVVAASRSSTERQNYLQAGAIGLVAVLFLTLGLAMSGGSPDLSSDTIAIVEHIRGLIFIPCMFACVHIRLRVLAEVVIAWRYGLDVRMAREQYPVRVKAVQVLLPLVAALPCFLLAYFQASAVRDLIMMPQGYMLVVSTFFLIIPYCYNRTADEFGEGVGKNRAPAWWSYALYLGGLISLVATFYSFSQVETAKSLLTLAVDVGLFGLMVLWQIIGHFFS